MKAIKYLVLLLIACMCACRAPKDLVYQEIRDFNISKAGLKETTLSMNVRLYNPNSYALKLKKADVDVLLNDKPLGKVSMKNKATVYGHDTCSLPIMLNVNLSEALPNAIQMLLNNEVNVKLAGSIKAGRAFIYVKIPVNYESKQSLFN